MKKNKTKKNWLEWSITIISGILVIFTLGFLVYQLIYEEQTPPDISVVLGEVFEKDEAYSVPIKAINEGTETAGNVVIEIVIEGDPEKEKAQITFAYLPGKSSAQGWVIFTKKPERKSLKTHVIGYSTP